MGELQASLAETRAQLARLREAAQVMSDAAGDLVQCTDEAPSEECQFCEMVLHDEGGADHEPECRVAALTRADAALREALSTPGPERGMTDAEKRDLVCFARSFRQDGSRGGAESPNITHATLDGRRTLCGRTGWMTSEGWHEMGPDCNACRRALERRGEVLL